MSVITKKGKAAAESANQGGGNVDLKKVFIKLKAGKSIKVRLLTAEDYVEYKGHGSYSKGIWTQPCNEPTGQKCALCQASDYKGGTPDANGYDEWSHLYAKKRYLFAFVDLETNELRVFDATKNQAKAIISNIDEYAENVGDIAFTFKRVGDSKDTTYSLNPILKMKDADQKVFDEWDGKEAEISFFEVCLQARTREQQLEDLQKAGFPLAEVFDAAEIANIGKSEETEDDSDDVTPIDENQTGEEGSF